MKKRIFIVTFAWMLAALSAAGCGNTETPAEEVAAEIEEAEEVAEETEAEPEEESDMEEPTEEPMPEEEEFVGEEAAEIPPVPETDEWAANFIGGSEMEAEELSLDEIDAYVKAMVAAEEANGNCTYVDISGLSVSHPEMLELVNADRAANGASALVWDADLEAYALERVKVVSANMQSAEYAEARMRHDGTSGMIAHRGSEHEEYGENAIIANYILDAFKVNTTWIDSFGHHQTRTSIIMEYTRYAAVSYLDPATGMNVWIEIFD